MSRGNGYLEKEDATNAVAAYARAIQLAPEDINVHLNLANAYLLEGSNAAVIDLCQQALKLDHNSAAAYYVMGLAYLHMDQPEPAVQAFEQSQKIDPAVTALNFQLALAQERLGHIDDAVQYLETVIQFEPEHPSAHYQLSRLLRQTGQADEAARELQKHQEVLAKNPGNASGGAAAFERCKYTQPQVAFVLEQPAERGIPVRFVDATAAALGAKAKEYHAPMTVMDYNHDGRNSLFVTGQGFRLLDNRQGHFEPLGNPLPGKPGVAYRTCLSGDLDNDGFEDAVVLGEEDSRVFKFNTNGQIHDVTKAAGLRDLKGRDGLLADLDFTGKLDLLAVLPGGTGLRVYRNLGNFYFTDKCDQYGAASALLPDIEGVTSEDWNSEGLPGIIVARNGHAPDYFAKERAGAFVETNLAADWPAGAVVTTGDLNNDLQPDLVMAGESQITVVFGGLKERLNLPLRGLRVKGLLLVDYDNDGWLDIFAYGDNGVRVWRNRGHLGFADVTAELGLESVQSADWVVAADFNGDGDTDLIISSTNGLTYWRNDGGNANRQLKVASGRAIAPMPARWACVSSWHRAIGGPAARCISFRWKLALAGTTSSTRSRCIGSILRPRRSMCPSRRVN